MHSNIFCFGLFMWNALKSSFSPIRPLQWIPKTIFTCIKFFCDISKKKIVVLEWRFKFFYQSERQLQQLTAQLAILEYWTCKVHFLKVLPRVPALGIFSTFLQSNGAFGTKRKIETNPIWANVFFLQKIKTPLLYSPHILCAKFFFFVVCSILIFTMKCHSDSTDRIELNREKRCKWKGKRGNQP